jgi:hypothetical protein
MQIHASWPSLSQGFLNYLVILDWAMSRSQQVIDSIRINEPEQLSYLLIAFTETHIQPHRHLVIEHSDGPLGHGESIEQNAVNRRTKSEYRLRLN